MYVRKGRKLTVEEVFDFLKNQTNNVSDDILVEYAKQIVKINDNLLKGRGVYGVLEKAPVSLEKGYHYFSIIYADFDEIRVLYLPKISNLIGAYLNKDKPDIPYFCFRSNVIGMSRLFHATDRLFKFLESLGGCYAQISLL